MGLFPNLFLFFEFKSGWLGQDLAVDGSGVDYRFWCLLELLQTIPANALPLMRNGGYNIYWQLTRQIDSCGSME